MFLFDAHFSTTNSPYIKPEWILVSHHPDDVIFISASTPLGSDLDDNFSQPPAEKIPQLIENIKYMHKAYKTINCYLMMTQEGFEITPEQPHPYPTYIYPQQTYTFNGLQGIKIIINSKDTILKKITNRNLEINSKFIN